MEDAVEERDVPCFCCCSAVDTALLDLSPSGEATSGGEAPEALRLSGETVGITVNRGALASSGDCLRLGRVGP